ncbi:MAG: hypothetical protein VYE15_07765 [Myxococcota bacterium]|nr:hypothetical protein [Myxococcota bacterium]
MTLRIAVRTFILVSILILVSGCGPDAPAPTTTAAATQPPAEAAPAPPPREIGGLDQRGNLRPGNDVAHGFAMPLTSAVLKQNPSVTEVYAESSIERLLRFYRSRGHLLTRTRSGWEVRHTPRTLKPLGVEGVSLGGAVMEMRQGPGPGWTLRVDSGKARPLRRPALTELLEQERRFQDAQDSKADSRGSAPKRSEAELDELKRRAFNRPSDKRRGRDISRDIYEYVKANPDKGFND